MPVLVTGATGCIGRELIPRLLGAGGQVRVYLRRDVPELRSLGVKVALGDADHEGRLESALEQVHTLIHLIGGPIPDKGVTVDWLNRDTTAVALRAAENAAVRRVLFLSPIGADPTSDNEYLAAKGRAEEAIEASELEYAIFRCSPVLAEGSALETFLARGVPSRARAAKMTPIAAADVADALLAADTRDTGIRGRWELGGPDIVTVEELAGAVKPGFIARPARELVDLYARDAVADPREAVTAFGLHLTPVIRR
jgi:NADH dehydrogenase